MGTVGTIILIIVGFFIVVFTIHAILLKNAEEEMDKQTGISPPKSECEDNLKKNNHEK